MSPLAVALAGIGALFGTGGIVALVQARSLNRKNTAEADATLGGGWQVLWQTAHADLNELRERLAKVEAAEAACQAKLAELERAGPAATEKLVKHLIDRELEARNG